MGLMDNTNPLRPARTAVSVQLGRELALKTAMDPCLTAGAEVDLVSIPVALGACAASILAACIKLNQSQGGRDFVESFLLAFFRDASSSLRDVGVEIDFTFVIRESDVKPS
jgi:hypothetical protein